jgi:hypothetical protein
MQSRNGQPARIRSAPGGAAVHVGSPQNQQVSGLGPGPRAGHRGSPGDPADIHDADITADGEVTAPVPAGSGPSRPGRPRLPEPPDRPRPPEPRDRPPPPVPSKLPKRTPDPSRPSVPSKLPKRSAPPGGTRPPQPSRGTSPPKPSGQPVLPVPSSWPPEPSGWSGEPVPDGKPRAAEPSWATVLATTARLWATRRLLWLRRPRPARARWRVVAVAGLVAVVFVAGAATVRLSGGGPGSQAAGGQPGGPALAAAAATRQQAAAWVAGQASGDAIVACDAAMCAALQARGVPAGRLLVLSTSRSDPLGSDLVVATPAVRSEFGPRLAGVYAPVTLAAFGSGAAQIDVRAVAPDGAAAYRTELAADVRARKTAGGLLLRNHRIRVAAGARPALADGDVDPRLLVTLAALAAIHPLDIIGFGGPGHGASAGVPLRSVEITGAGVTGTGPPGSRHPASLHSLATVLRAQRSPYLPAALDVVRLPARGPVLRIEYPVPVPLGLLGSGG